MCGFVGFYSPKKYDENVIKEMNEMIVHRGPDSEGYYKDRGVQFGFRRLSIIDLEGGSQPLVNEAGDIALVFNGEIYNYKEIKKDLIEEGCKFKTETDTEVILHGYEVYGEKGLLERLRGMFAFTIWDGKKERLIGARDHFGIKPYYYAWMGEDFLFASEIKGMLPHPAFKKEVNKEVLKNYLVFQYNPSQESFFKGVHKLRPGHYFCLEKGKFESHKYFSIKLDYEDLGLERTVQKITDTVEESVRYHQNSDVKIAAFLSGGVDSSYVTATALPECTFSVGFENEGFDETVYAKELSEKLNIENKAKIISKEEFFQAVPKVQYFSDEPHANLSSVALYYLSELAGRHATVILSGEGADELFAGYNEYEEARPQRIYSKLAFPLRRALYKWAKNKKHFHGRTIIMKYGQKVEDRYIGQAHIMSDEEANSLLTKEYRSDVKSTDLTRVWYDDVKEMDDISKRIYLDMNMWLVDDILLKADKMTMAHSIEVRTPLLDLEMWNLARRIPPKYKVKGTDTKYAFREAALRKLPKDWARRRKAGFMVPFIQWIREEKFYKKVKEIFEKPYVDEFFEKEKLLQMLEMHYKGEANLGRKIYTVYTFLLWYEEYFIKR